MYSLSTKTPDEEKNLKTCLRSAIPLSIGGGKGALFGGVTPTQRKQYFVLISATPIDGMDVGHVENLNYQVSFIDNRGKCEPSVWITGEVMSSLVTCQTVKMKYVFDNTIKHQEGWISMSSYKQSQNQSLSQSLSQSN